MFELKTERHVSTEVYNFLYLAPLVVTPVIGSGLILSNLI